MFLPDQIVRYGAHGICRVHAVVDKKFGKEIVQYYELHPVSQDSAAIYVPTGNAKLVERMQKLLSREEILRIMRGEEQELVWIDEDVKRRESYTAVLHSGDRADMARLIRTLHKRQSELALKRKKLHIADEKLMKDAQRVLVEEFAYVLGVREKEVLSYLLPEEKKEEAV